MWDYNYLELDLCTPYDTWVNMEQKWNTEEPCHPQIPHGLTGSEIESPRWKAYN